MYGQKRGSSMLSIVTRSPFFRRWATLADLFRPGNRGITILCYHRVHDESDFFCRAIAPGLFRKQLKRLKRWCRFISLDEAVNRIGSRDHREGKSVVVTFDDGYRDNYTQAFPILRELGIPATVFLTTDLIGTNRLLWHDRLAFYLNSLERFEEQDIEARLRITFGESSSLSASILRFTRSRGEEKIVEMFELAGLLKGLPLSEMESSLDKLAGISVEAGEESSLPRLMLDWNEIREMAEHNMTFGAHTRRHVILSLLSGEELVDELTTPRETIASRLGKEAPFLAYPNGTSADFNDEVIEEARKAGYRAACTLIPGKNGAGQDLFRLFRKGAPGSPYLFV